jgi:chromosome segregation ATPase
MDHFSPGIRAFRRYLARLDHRVRLYFARRNVAKAETELGLLGWQQAEFDPETQRQVDALQNVEREQAELSNRSAENAHALEQVAAERSALRAAFDRDSAVLEAERTKTREPLAALREQIDKMREANPAAERRAAELEKELRDVEKLYNRLLHIQPQTAEVRDEILGLRDQLIAVPNERKDLLNQCARRAGEIQSREEQIAAIEEATAEVDRRMRERKNAFQAEDDILARKQRELERDKARAQAEHEQLERAKINPYREIGIVLADNNVGPMNQPQALQRVLECRSIVLSHRQEIVDLDAAAAAEDRVQVQMSFAIWAAILFALALLVAALW